MYSLNRYYKEVVEDVEESKATFAYNGLSTNRGWKVQRREKELVVSEETTRNLSRLVKKSRFLFARKENKEIKSNETKFQSLRGHIVESS